jgi:hypothetical protein
LLREGTLSILVTCGNQEPQETTIGKVQLIDPSGIITDALSGEPIEGATVQLFKLPGWSAKQHVADSGAMTCDTLLTKDAEVTWNEMDPAPTDEGIPADPQADPQEIDPLQSSQTTGTDGRYGWDVAAGCWYVVVKAEGYKSRISPAVGVPPAVTDLDLALVPQNSPTMQLSANSISVSEDGGSVSIEVTVSAASGSVSVDYATSDGWAEAGTDYTATSGTLTLAAGETSQTITIPITDDEQVEEMETFTLHLSNAQGAALGTPAQATVSIRDNDAPQPTADEHTVFLAVVMR